MLLANLAKFLLGFILAIALLIGGAVAAGLYMMTIATAPPPKPMFANDKTAVKAQRPPASTTAKPKPVPAAQPSATPTPSETPSPEPLEPGAYRALVTWSEGLSLRSEPNLDAERVGGVGYNQKIVVLEESADKNWQRIRMEDSEQEGWVKAGNTERIEE